MDFGTCLKVASFSIAKPMAGKTSKAIVANNV